MAGSGRWGRVVSRWGVRLMDGVVSAVSGRSVRTAATAEPAALVMGRSVAPQVSGGAEASGRRSVASPEATARKSAGALEASARKSAGPREASAKKSAEPREAAAKKSAEPREAAARKSAEPREASARKSAEPREAVAKKSAVPSEAAARKSAAPSDASAKKSAAPPPPRRKLVAVARDPDVAFVYWSCDDTTDAKLVWRAGERTVRVERVSAASGKQYLPFVAPDTPHSATLEIGDVHVTSNAVRPPPAAPRAAGPGVFVARDDPERRVLAERQRTERAALPRPAGRAPSNAPSSRGR